MRLVGYPAAILLAFGVLVPSTACVAAHAYDFPSTARTSPPNVPPNAALGDPRAPERPEVVRFFAQPQTCRKGRTRDQGRCGWWPYGGSAFAHGPFAGRSIGDVAGGLRSGAISPSDLPIEVIRRGGETLALNTRSTLALRRGGVDPAGWTARDVTGNAAREQLLTERLARNGLDGGTDVLRITGAGRYASSMR